ncbi:MAG TPA: hypothetical protein VF701_18110 [Thermoanaerobaculia bacterium]
MRFEIGSSRADIQVLLTTLRGIHRRSRMSVVGTALLSLVIAAVLPALVAQGMASSDTTDRLFVVGMTLFLGAFAGAMVLEALVTYTVDEFGIAKKHLFQWFSWHIDRADIHSIDLVIETGWTLEVTTTGSKRRALELDGSLREALATLYPEVTPYRPSSTDVTRWKWLAAGIAVLVGIVAGVVWWLTHRGVLYWP